MDAVVLVLRNLSWETPARPQRASWAGGDVFVDSEPPIHCYADELHGCALRCTNPYYTQANQIRVIHSRVHCCCSIVARLRGRWAHPRLRAWLRVPLPHRALLDFVRASALVLVVHPHPGGPWRRALPCVCRPTWLKTKQIKSTLPFCGFCIEPLLVLLKQVLNVGRFSYLWHGLGRYET